MQPESELGIVAPFAGWSRPVQLVVLLLLFVATLACMRYLKEQGRLVAQRLEQGTLALEVPWSAEIARRNNEKLGADGVEAARQQTLTDFLFLVLYACTLSLACSLLAGEAQGSLRAVGIMAAWAALAAGGFDAIENVAMLRMLSGATNAPWPQLSTVCASLKFTLVLGALAYVLIGLSALVVGWARG